MRCADCHDRAWPGHPRLLADAQTRKTWMAGPRPVMTAGSMSRHQRAWVLGADLCRRFGLAAEFVAPRPQAARAGLQGIVLGEVDRAMHLTDDLRCNRRRIAGARPCDPAGRLPCSRWRSRILARFSGPRRDLMQRENRPRPSPPFVSTIDPTSRHPPLATKPCATPSAIDSPPLVLTLHRLALQGGIQWVRW